MQDGSVIGTGCWRRADTSVTLTWQTPTGTFERESCCLIAAQKRPRSPHVLGKAQGGSSLWQHGSHEGFKRLLTLDLDHACLFGLATQPALNIERLSLLPG